MQRFDDEAHAPRQGLAKQREIGGLVDVFVDGAGVHRGHRAVDVSVGRDQDAHDGRPALAHLGEQFHAALARASAGR